MSESQSRGDAFPLEWFPGQLFPDIELEQVEIDDTAIRVLCRDGDWSLQSDITPFWGPGTMVFHTRGEIEVRIQEGEHWPRVERELAQEKLLPHFHTLELIERSTPGACAAAPGNATPWWSYAPRSPPSPGMAITPDDKAPISPAYS